MAAATALEPAVPAQAEAIAALINRSYRGHDGAATGWTSSGHLLGGQRTDAAAVAERLQAPGCRCLVLCESEGLVACVLLSLAGPGVGEIGLLAVRPDRQSSGLGRRLLAAAEKELVARWQVRDAELTVLSPRPELEAWYGRRGYLPTGRRRRLDDAAPAEYGVPLRAGLELVDYRKRLG